MSAPQRLVAPAAVLLALAAASLAPAAARAGTGEQPSYLADRGAGMPASMFGTYLREGELLVYPFFEYYRNSDEEYAPSDLGYEGEDDYRGDFRASEGVLYLGYGLARDWLVELEAGVIDARLRSAPEDASQVPDEISESGVSDVEGQLRWRAVREGAAMPEVFTYLEVVAPVNNDMRIIGTPDWEFKLGAGVTKGFGWGTITARAAAEYLAEESQAQLGEYALEYLKRLSPSWKAFLAVEGSEDELECIPELLWTFREAAPRMTLVLNSAFGISSKAQDWAPEVGVQLLF